MVKMSKDTAILQTSKAFENRRLFVPQNKNFGLPIVNIYFHTNSYTFAMTAITQDDHLKA